MKRNRVLGSALILLLACRSSTEAPQPVAEATNTDSHSDERFAHVTNDRFGDSAMLRYRVPGFETLPLQKKLLAYYLYEAGLSGRDIIYDQKYRHNLTIRRTLEAILTSAKLDKSSDDYRKLHTYTKKVWFARGIHHDYAKDKFIPEFTADFFKQAVGNANPQMLPLAAGQSPQDLADKLIPILFNPKIAAKGVNKGEGVDLVADSANNFYEGLTEKEAREFYRGKMKGAGPTPVSFGLNSKLIKQNGKVVEQVWKIGGMYSPALEKMAGWLKKAASVAESPKQKEALEHLVKYYETGDLKHFDDYNIAWVKDTKSTVDAVNGFIEVYGDPLAFKGTYESVVSIRDEEASKRIGALAANAQWFEDQSPIAPEHKKKSVVGISAKVITVVVEAGDTAPTSPIGINLPNANWIRKEHGSKSVTLGNIMQAYDAAKRAGGALDEFAANSEEVARGKKHGGLALTLKVDLHEVIGHASGQLEPGVKTPKETLRQYGNAIEEGRADLVALYYVMDPKLIELGLVPDLEVGKAAYDGYIRNALLTQMARIEEGNDLEEAHMQNRQMIGLWAYEHGKKDNVIERIERGGKTYFQINDYPKLRGLFGALLKEVQRVKSEGDFKGAKHLIDTYGTKLDAKLHTEVRTRYQKLDLPTYYGFIQPKLVPIEKDGAIVDVKVEYPADFTAQQLEYSKAYSFLPHYN